MEKFCQTCGVKFTPKYTYQKYCSQKCAKKAKSKWSKEYKQKCRETLTEKVCPVCGEEFKPKFCNQKYCSRECQYIAHHATFANNIVEVPEVSEEKLFVRVKSTFEILEDYYFTTFKQAVNYLSTFSSVDTAECLTLLRERKNKIGHYKIFYD